MFSPEIKTVSTHQLSCRRDESCDDEDEDDDDEDDDDEDAGFFSCIPPVWDAAWWKYDRYERSEQRLLYCLCLFISADKPLIEFLWIWN